MNKVLGIDPGSLTWDFFALKGKEVILDSSISTKEVIEEPSKAISIIKSIKNLDLIVAPSGFGLPLKNVKDITEKDIFLTLLKFNKKEREQLVGLGEVLRLIKAENLPGIIIPGVKHLPTIPRYRKINKIDMGTADKLCTVVTGIRDQIERLEIQPANANFIMVELGHGFSAVLAIENGQVIDGIGGSNIMGFKACGGLDGELAYLIKNIKKNTIYGGGLSSISGNRDLTLNQFTKLVNNDHQTRLAFDAYISDLTKAIFAIYSSFSHKDIITELLLAGRCAENRIIRDEISNSLKGFLTVKLMQTYGKISKHAAQGAAFIANGLLGGEFGPIVNNLKIKEAKGSVLDDIYIPFDKNKILSDLN
ncbi:MAG: DUF1464 family protein [Candidatus Lokiarchaeota archaeon]|nr:DUF1464 family protein [Candidatus Lokiarchaeota archaeon]